MKRYNHYKELSEAVGDWMYTEVPKARLEGGAQPFTNDSLKVTDLLKIENTAQITDRQDLNTEFVNRYEERDVASRKGISAIKNEIDQLLSFTKCFVERHKSRLDYIRADLSMKRRVCQAVGQANGGHALFKEALDR